MSLLIASVFLPYTVNFEDDHHSVTSPMNYCMARQCRKPSVSSIHGISSWSNHTIFNNLTVHQSQPPPPSASTIPFNSRDQKNNNNGSNLIHNENFIIEDDIHDNSISRNKDISSADESSNSHEKGYSKTRQLSIDVNSNNNSKPTTTSTTGISSNNEGKSASVLNGDGMLSSASSKHRFFAHFAENYRIIPSSFGNIGLQNAVHSVYEKFNSLPKKQVWIGTLGNSWKHVDPTTKSQIEKELLMEYDCCAVDLTEEEFEGHYHQFCKQVLWKCFHYQLGDYPHLNLINQAKDQAWHHYVKVNQKFAKAIASVYQPGDLVWVNDYHLMLVPLFLKEILPDANVGFFLHIPFPSSEIFRCLHVRKEILEGLLSADLIGFQTYSYARHFFMTCTRLLALETTPRGIRLDNKFVSVGIYPIGINLEALNMKRRHPDIHEMVISLREKYAGMKIIIGRDKNDYVKGVRQKLLAYEFFLQNYPEFVGKVVLIQVVLSTSEVNENECQVSDVVARINSKFGSIEHQPVVYLQQDISFYHYLTLFTVADVCLITSLRDGMNLTSHEFIVCQEGKHGPLILSEFAGSYGCLGAALRVNPWNKREVAETIYEALTMCDEEKEHRWNSLFLHVSINSAQIFTSNFIQDLIKVHEEQQANLPSALPLLQFKTIYDMYDKCDLRLLLLDHDGTLLPPLRTNTTAYQTHLQRVLTLLQELVKDKRNIVYVMSGRTKSELSSFQKIEGLGLCSENGAFIKYTDASDFAHTSINIDTMWKKQVSEILDYYTDRTPGSFIEQKETAMAWHYGLADLHFASWQAAELQNHIEQSIAPNYPIQVMAKKKSVEIGLKSVNKGIASSKILEYHHLKMATNPHDSQEKLFEEQIKDKHIFIFAVGDDRSDEYMFEYLNNNYVGSLISSLSPLKPGATSVTSHTNTTLTSDNNSHDNNTDNFLKKTLSSVSEYHLKNKKSLITCTIGKKSSAANSYLPGYLDISILMDGFLKGVSRIQHPYLMVSTGRSNSSLSLNNLSL